MNEKEKAETVSAICNLLRDTTQKRLVADASIDDTAYLTSDELEDMRNNNTGRIRVEYYNTIFTQQEVEVLKRKLLKLVEQL